MEIFKVIVHKRAFHWMEYKWNRGNKFLNTPRFSMFLMCNTLVEAVNLTKSIIPERTYLFSVVSATGQKEYPPRTLYQFSG
jgi:hypothetical protein